MVGHVLVDGVWVPWVAPVVDPFLDDAPLMGGPEAPEVCDSCQ